MDIQKSMEIYKDRFEDFSDFTFVFVGSFELEKIKPLVDTYLGSLPSINRQENFKDKGLRFPEGVIKKEVKKGMEYKSMVNITYSGPYTWSFENSYLLRSLTSVFRIKIREVLREDKGGTYGVKVSSEGNREPQNQYSINISFGCDPDRVDELTTALYQQIDSLVFFPLDLTYIDKVKEIQKRELETQRKENDYWLGILQTYYFYGMNPDDIFNNDKLIDTLTPERIKTAAEKYLNTENLVEVIMYPESTL